MRKNLVVKSNTLNQITFYNSTIQLKMFSKIILEIRKNKNQDVYKFSISDLIKEFDFSKKHYGELKRICEKMNYMVNVSQKVGFHLKVLFYDIKTDEKGYLCFKVNPDLKDYILEQSKNFTSYFLENVSGLKSIYSFRIYELLKQFQDKKSLEGWYKIELKALKEKLNIDENQYRLYGHFKDKVIKQAQKELKAKTDLYFDFEEIKQVRKVEFIVFHIKPNQKIIEELKKRNIQDESLFINYQEPLKQEIKQDTRISQDEQDNLKNTEIYNFLIKEFNLDDSFIHEIFAKYDKDRLKRNFDYVVKKIKNDEIKSNIGGFLRVALEQDFANTAKKTKKTKGIFHIAKDTVIERFIRQFKK